MIYVRFHDSGTTKWALGESDMTASQRSIVANHADTIQEAKTKWLTT